MVTTSFEDTRGVLLEAIKVFTPGQDVEAITQLKRTVEETEELRKKQQLEVRRIIKGEKPLCVEIALSAKILTPFE